MKPKVPYVYKKDEALRVIAALTKSDFERIVAEKDAEIQRLRQTLTLAEHKIVQYLRGQYSDGVSLRSTWQPSAQPSTRPSRRMVSE